MLRRGGKTFYAGLLSCGSCKRLIFSSLFRYAPESRHYDVVIAGGGIMGCSSAYFLAQRMPAGSICIVERDPTYKMSSTVLSVGSIRQQFSIKGNILMSLRSSQFLRQVSSLLQVEEGDPPDIQLTDGGYLFLASKEGERVLRENYRLQRSVGAEVELLDSQGLARRFPWMNVDGVNLGCLGVKNEGWFDPWMLLRAFKKKVTDMGVHFVEAEVTNVTVEENKVRDVKVAMDSKEQVDEVCLSCDTLINACGPWASKVALLAGVGDKSHSNPLLHVPLPVSPRKRCVFVIKCPSGPREDCPLVVDNSGTYFRREGDGGMYLTGISPPEHLDVDNDELEVDYSIFDKLIWPKLAHRIPAFENLKVQSAWAGYYEYNTLDQNGIIGAHPVISNLIFANGFSGHGIQQSPAVGEAVSEIVLDGKTHSIDLQDFSFERIVENRPLREKNVV